MLAAAGVRHIARASIGAEGSAGALVLRAADGGSSGLALALFKALQLIHARELDAALERYVTFDLETTDADVTTCGVVEIGATRVVNGAIAETFQTLVRPTQPISRGAANVHGYTDEAVRGAPSFAEVWPAFRAFVGNDLLIAHNGQHFDIPGLRRLAAGMAAVDTLVFYDTLPRARSLSRGDAQLEDPADHVGVDPGSRHHALE